MQLNVIFIFNYEHITISTSHIHTHRAFYFFFESCACAPMNEESRLAEASSSLSAVIEYDAYLHKQMMFGAIFF